MNRYEAGGTVSATLKDFENDLEVRQFATQPGCYVIRSPDAVLYAGSSEVSMTSRLLGHVNGRGTAHLFNRLQRGKRCRERLTIMLCPTLPQQARQKETELIEAYNPIYNSKRPSVTVL